jgi:methionine salvage enolase-phosphatase E1
MVSLTFYRGYVILEDIETSVHNLSLILDEMLADKNKNMTDLVEKRKTIKETIEQARTRINNYLDELERSLEHESDIFFYRNLETKLYVA